MKRMLVIIATIAIFAVLFVGGALAQSGSGSTGAFGYGDGSDGDLTVSSPQAMNSYHQLAGDYAAGSTSITVQDATGLASGDEILLLQLRGPDNLRGQFEIIESIGVSGNVITLPLPLQYDYTSEAFAVNVPHYANLHVMATGQIQPANRLGSSGVGGVVVFRVQNTLTIDTGGSIRADGYGFEGGFRGYTTGSFGTLIRHAWQGDSHLGSGAQVYYLPNGAGGAGGRTGRFNSGYGGGGGGGHASSGGAGGGQTNARGVGGDPIGFDCFDDPTDDRLRIFAGSGGGGSGEYYGTNKIFGVNGGDGGGIIMLYAREIAGSGDISANGTTKPHGANHNGSGGGAGGSILIQTDSANLNSLTAKGGAGGPGSGSTGIPGFNGVGGGAGSNGRIRINDSVVLSVNSIQQPSPCVALPIVPPTEIPTDEPTPPPPDPSIGLIAHWKAENNALDSVNGHHGTLVNGAGFDVGFDGQAFALDGQDDYIEAPGPAFSTDTFSVSLWVNTTASGRGQIIGDYTGGDNKGWYIDINHPDLAQDRVFLFAGTGNTQYQLAHSTVQINDGQWHHIVMTKGPDGLNLYVDGVRDFTQDALTGIPTDVSDVGQLRIGAGEPVYRGSVRFSGLIDEVKFWNRVLSDEEVAQLVSSVSPIALWHADGDALDSAGTNHGALFNGASFAASLSGQAFAFDGVDDYFDAGDVLDNSSGTMTVETCFQVSSIHAGAQALVSKFDGFSALPDGNRGFELGFQGIDERLWFLVEDGTSGVQLSDRVTSAGTWNDGLWHYAIATWNSNGGMTLYVDGQLEDELATTTVPAIPDINDEPNNHFTIGASSLRTGNHFFDGLIDEVAMYDVALTAEQIAERFAASPCLPVEPVNTPPTADAGGPYSVNEGGSVDLSGAGSDPDGDTLTIAWDLDNDGTFETAGQDVTFSAAGRNGPDSQVMALQVCDLSNACAIAEATVSILNVAPTATAGPDRSRNEGQQTFFLGNFTDPGTGEAYTIEWDFGDGETASGSLSASHIYADDGEYTVALTVSDDDGGSSASTLTVTVENVAPTVNLGLTVSAVNEGGPVGFSGSFSDPGTDDTHTLAWDFGDGNTAVGGLARSHTYGDDGTYTVSLTVTDDDDGKTTMTAAVTVANVAPEVDAGSDTLAADEGTALDFAGTFLDPGTLDTHTIVWDFHDGTTSTGTLSPTHAYADNGEYTATLKVTDDDGASDTDTIAVSIANVPPSAEAGPDQTVDEGSAVAFAGSFRDPGAGDTHTLAWDFGDDIGTSGTLAPQHTYPDEGVFAVGLTVTDDDGAADSDSLTVTVVNVAPTVSAADAAINEGDSFSQTGSFADPGDDVWAATVDYGDGSGAQPLPLNPDKTFALEHVYGDNAVFPVTITIDDGDGGVGMITINVTVHNINPSVDVGPDVVIFADEPFTLPGSYSDPGFLDTHTAVIDWGDGAASAPAPLDAGAKTVVDAHTFFTPGTYTLTLTVTDDDDGVGSDTLILTVYYSFMKFCLYGDKDSASLQIHDGTVTDCSVGGRHKVDIKKDVVIGGFVIAMEDKVDLHDDVQVAGDVTAAGDVKLHKRAQVAGSVVSGDKVDLHDAVNVAGDVTASRQVKTHKNVTVGGSIVEGAPAPFFAPITMPSFDITAGSEDVKVKKDETLALPPGTYAKLEVKAGATLILSAGHYTFREVKVDKDATIHLDIGGGTIVIDVEKKMDVKDRVQMMTTGAASNILWRIEEGHVYLHKDGVYLGTFLAPTSHIELHDGSALAGALYGEKVDVKKDVVITGDPAFDLVTEVYQP